MKKEKLTEGINFQDSNSKYTRNKNFNLQDPLDNIPLSKTKYQNIFLQNTEKSAMELERNYQNLDPVIRQLKSWHKYKTKSINADITIFENNTLLRFFKKFNNTTINENKILLEYHTPKTKIRCLPLSMILLAFHFSRSLNTKRHAGLEKTYSNFIQNSYFPKAPSWMKVLCYDCIYVNYKNHIHAKKTISRKKNFKGKVYISTTENPLILKALYPLMMHLPTM